MILQCREAVVQGPEAGLAASAVAVPLADGHGLQDDGKTRKNLVSKNADVCARVLVPCARHGMGTETHPELQ